MFVWWDEFRGECEDGVVWIWRNECVFFLVDLEDKFEDNFMKINEWFDWYDRLKKVIIDKT